jgi:glyoxylase-like metal-dependent hydrolase (beta-lactamase superfamily II)
MTTLGTGIGFEDLEFLGMPRVIATVMVEGPDGLAIVDPGPSTTLPTLIGHLRSRGARVGDIRSVLLTHIHLDHAGATGLLVRDNPALSVYVHRVGAPHLVDPSKLLASAGRLWGAEMDRLWGAVEPVPASNLIALDGGERIEVGGRMWEVAYTPGHASHHVSYFSEDIGTAFVGDTAGVRVTPDGFVLPPTPPPDIDLPLWASSLDTIEAWHPRTLFLTHFGPSTHVPEHLQEMREHLALLERLGREAFLQSEDEAGREAWFVEQVRRDVAARTSDRGVEAYEAAGRFDLSWKGLSRYLTKGPRR